MAGQRVAPAVRLAVSIAIATALGACGSSPNASPPTTTVSSTTPETSTVLSTTTTTAPPTTVAPEAWPDASNATYPADSCLSTNGSGWESSPIEVVGGSGEARLPDGSFGGATLEEVTEIGRGDVDGDGTAEIIASAYCFGSTIDQCCAGRGSRLLTIFAISGRDSDTLELVGGPLFGQADPPRSIAEARIDGDTIVTRESLLYPESDEGGPITVRYLVQDGRWSAVAAPAEGPPVTDRLGDFTIDQCRSSDAPPFGSESAIELAAACTFMAWRAEDRELAAAFADPEAVDGMFGRVDRTIGWALEGCTSDQPDGGWLGWVCSFSSSAGALRLLPVAYDDVVVMGSIETPAP